MDLLKLVTMALEYWAAHDLSEEGRAAQLRQVAHTSGAAASSMQMYSDRSWCEHASIPKKQLPSYKVSFLGLVLI
ncbi:hypothetical protein AV530_007427 [Patagioenas fasciata monilis]|nr:hypothetical protein AV530_007427 [Patagioenas fasciata monilis]